VPPVALFVGIIALFIMSRRRHTASAEAVPLSSDEEKRLSTLVDPAVPDR